MALRRQLRQGVLIAGLALGAANAAATWARPLAQGGPQFAAADTVVDCGVADLTEGVPISLTLSNPGDAALAIASIRDASAVPGVFSVSPTTLGLDPGQNRSVVIRFAPTTVGWASTHLVVVHNGASSPDTISVSGIGRVRASQGLWTHSRLVFETSRDGNAEIYSAAMDGSTPTNLTRDAAADRNPDWSPSGTAIVFDSDRSGNLEIWSMGADGAGLARLTNQVRDDRDPVWSPDGTKIAFFSSRDGDYEIFVMAADGTQVRQLTTNTSLDAHPCWAPDGSKIAFMSDRAGNNDIYVMAADGTAQTRLTTVAASDQHPAWSPDGTKIAFHSDRTGLPQVWLMDADGRNQTQLTASGGVDASWSPDGSCLAYAANKTGLTKLYRVQADGTGDAELAAAGSGDAEPDWSRYYRAPDISLSATGLDFGTVNAWRVDRRSLVVTNVGDTTLLVSGVVSPGPSAAFTTGTTSMVLAPGESAPWTVLCRPGNPGPLAGGLVLAHNASGAPDTVALAGACRVPDLPDSFLADTRLAFVGGQTDDAQLMVLGPGTTVTAVTPALSGSQSGIAWAPSGRRLAFTAMLGGSTRIHVVDRDSARGTPLTPGPGPDQNPAWSPRATELLFDSYRDRNAIIMAVATDGTGATRVVGDNPAQDAQPSWSPDGRQIAFRSARAGSTDIWRMDADGSSPTRLTSTASWPEFPTWSPVGDRIGFRSAGSMATISTDGARLTALADSVCYAPLAWSPDGTRIAFARYRLKSPELHQQEPWLPASESDIYVMAADGSGLVNVTQDPAVDQAPTWSPDGGQLAFVSDRTGLPMLYVVNADGTNLVQVAGPVAAILGPLAAWSPRLAAETPAAPELAHLGDRLVAEGDSLAIPLSARDANGDSLTFTASGAPPGSSLTGTVFSWRPGYTQAGTYLITFTVGDGNGGSDSEVVTVQVTETYLPITWRVPVTVVGADGTSTELWLGTAPGASDGLDPEYGEQPLPPLPPLALFDARWLAAGTEGTVADIRSDDRELQTWLLALQPGLAGHPFAVHWGRSQLPAAGSFRLIDQTTGGLLVNIDLRGRDGCSVTNPAVTRLLVVYRPLTSYVLTAAVAGGWSMVSLPCAVADARVTTVFPSAVSLFSFASGYRPAATLVPGTGYWLNMASAAAVSIAGNDPDPQSLALSLPAGWSMVGPGTKALDTGYLKGAYPDLRSVFAYDQGYRLADTMEPGSAYWVNLSAPGVLDLSGSVAAASLGRPSATNGPSPAGAAGVVWVVGRTGRQPLELGVSSDRIVELPPLPPAGVFDARVELAQGAGSWQVPAGDGSYRVRMQGGVEALRWDGLADSDWEVVVDDSVVPLLGSGQVPVHDGANVVLRHASTVPQATDLHGAYPNPFNPTTTIRYDLAQPGEVRLQVYAVSGQLVRELVTAHQEAGTYRVEWDGRDSAGTLVGNGVYLGVLEAGDFRAVTRMVLMK